MNEYHVGTLSDLPEGEVTLVDVQGTEVGIIRLKDMLTAFENRCPHQGGPVCYGNVLPQIEPVFDENGHVLGEQFSNDTYNLICPWHGWSFDASTGRCISDQRLRLRPWDVVERDGEVFLIKGGRGSGGEQHE